MDGNAADIVAGLLYQLSRIGSSPAFATEATYFC